MYTNIPEPLQCTLKGLGTWHRTPHQIIVVRHNAALSGLGYQHAEFSEQYKKSIRKNKYCKSSL